MNRIIAFSLFSLRGILMQAEAQVNRTLMTPNLTYPNILTNNLKRHKVSSIKIRMNQQ